MKRALRRGVGERGWTAPLSAVMLRAPAWKDNQNFLLEGLEMAEGDCGPAPETAGTLAGVGVKTRLLWSGQTPGIFCTWSRTEVFFMAVVQSRRMLTLFDLHKRDLV